MVVRGYCNTVEYHQILSRFNSSLSSQESSDYPKFKMDQILTSPIFSYILSYYLLTIFFSAILYFLSLYFYSSFSARIFKR